MGGTITKENSKDPKYNLEVDDELNDILDEEIKKLYKNNSPKEKTLKKIKTKKPLKNSSINNNYINIEEESEEEGETEIYLNNITDLVDLVYTKNINMQLKNRPNKTIYETVFDIRNIIDSEQNFNNDEFNKKSCEVMKEIIEPDITDKINHKKEELKVNNNEENKENNKKEEEEKSESSENNFFKKWDYINDDIFNNGKDDIKECELNLDYYENKKDKLKTKKHHTPKIDNSSFKEDNDFSKIDLSTKTAKLNLKKEISAPLKDNNKSFSKTEIKKKEKIKKTKQQRKSQKKFHLLLIRQN